MIIPFTRRHLKNRCERAGSFSSIWHFVKRAGGCWHEHWPAAMEKQRAFVDLLELSGANSFPFKLYNEVWPVVFWSTLAAKTDA
jgi:hypothetical protein